MFNYLIKKLHYADDILEISHHLQSNISSKHEDNLKILESKIADENFPLITEIAQSTSLKSLNAPPSPKTPDEACVLRYLYIPILYKIGANEEAVRLSQITFEYLFPALDQAIQEIVHELYNGNLEKNYQEVLQEFNISNPDILKIYSRIKTTNSIWKKIKSTSQLQKYDALQFAKEVKDFIGIRWIMKILPDENRFDALINGLRIAPLSGLYQFTNQQLLQKQGFDCEPVMKLMYIQNNLPIELQLLGGSIELYMAAKAYANHKAKIIFPPKQDELSDIDWNSRLGMCIQFSESHRIIDFQKLMLDELKGSETQYDYHQKFILDEKPLNEINLEFKFFDSEKPIYQVANLSV